MTNFYMGLLLNRCGVRRLLRRCGIETFGRLFGMSELIVIKSGHLICKSGRLIFGVGI